ncbi:Protein arginine N-methyltransferase 7 [Eumeta japonica]|uniref:Protein arginine N-methyltransferase n=1 Tax=Eumeta variegata TaxID=151549 RepID=A0A4C1X5Q1_EUMVA|nr:Protein arginine N-methyltransferase 7 [Eumeta japonica]
MQVFTLKRNPLTGDTEWDVQHEEYDYHQEIARSAFADMLHDTERNKKYQRALQLAIQKMHEMGKKANVLDIGTGTGLLSIMAARCGADSIVACEAFKPMAECAAKILERNDVADKITLIPKRSTDITVGENGDMKEKANILVTEVFDTELIGEGALSTFSHAHQCLLEEDCIVIPDSAVIYAQIVECPTLLKWNKLNDLADEDLEIILKTPQKMKDCAGSAAVHDVQLSQLPRNAFRELSEQIPIFYYDWSGKTPIDMKKIIKQQFAAVATGRAQVVFMWWELNMDAEVKLIEANNEAALSERTCKWFQKFKNSDFDKSDKDRSGRPKIYKDAELEELLEEASSQTQKEVAFTLEVTQHAVSHRLKSLGMIHKQGRICLSCAPWWCHSDADIEAEYPQDTIPWRDHWMQGVYYLPNEMTVQKDLEYSLVSCQDEYSLWFYLEDEKTRSKTFLAFLRKEIDKNSVVLDMNGSTLLGLAAAKIGAKIVYILENMNLNVGILTDYIKENSIDNVQIVADIEEDSLKAVTHVICDPNFSSSILPWENLKFAYLLYKYKTNLKTDVKVMPQSCEFWAMPVQFLDLHKIRVPLENCEGIDMTLFDELIEKSRVISDQELEPHPLWEYPCYSRGTPRKLITFEFSELPKTYALDSTFNFVDIFQGDESRTVNGFVVWAVWHVGITVLSTGPLANAIPASPEERVRWDPHTRQAVRLLVLTVFSIP